MKIQTWALVNTIITTLACVSLGTTVYLGGEIIKEKRANLALISRVAPQVFALQSLVDEYLSEPSADIEKKWLQESAHLLRDIQLHRTSEPRRSQLVKVLEADHASVQDVFLHQVTNPSRNGSDRSNAQLGTERTKEIRRQIASRYQTLLNDNLALRDFESLEIWDQEKQVVKFFLANAVFLMLFVIGNFFLIRRRVFVAVRLLQKGTLYIGEGNFDQPVNLRVKNEMGELSLAIDHMAQRLKQTTASRDELERNVTELRRAELSLRDGQDALKHQQSALRDTSRLLKAVMDNTLSYIHIRDTTGRFVYVNEEYKRVFGVSGIEVEGKLIEEIFQGEIAIMRREMHEAVIAGRVDVHAEILQTVAGIEHTYQDVKSPLFDESGAVYAVYCIGTDVTELKRLEASMAELAHTDLVTRLPNRVLFQDRLNEAVKRALQTQKNLALLFIDLDAFKDVNDTLGHDCGDILLNAVGARLVSAVRNSDTVARIGGDEFTVILEGLPTINSIELVTQKILDALLPPFDIQGREISISASIGITVAPRDAGDAASLMKNADQAMYAAKRHASGTYRFFTDVMNEEADNRLRIISDLKIAIRDSQFHLLYQPIVSLQDGAIQKAEALIRWLHPIHGLINPADFIAIAETTGDIITIGEWVFREAVTQCADWRMRFDETFQISINTSPVQYRSPGIDSAAWGAYLVATGLPAEAIVIEITEGVLMEAGGAVQEQLHLCSSLGMGIALDDFGTGYSSLSYLKRFDVDYLKIDRAFVTNLAANSNDLVLCEAIVVMAHKLGLKVIAEGIETELQRDLLTSAGCDFGQGYYFSKPVSADLFERHLHRKSVVGAA